jgi:hypothetical protein
MKKNTLLDLAESFGVTEANLVATGSGPVARRRAMAKSRMVRVAEASEIIAQARSGSSYAQMVLQEALTTSDLFQSVVGDVFDRIMLAQYQAMPASWSKFSTRTTLKDFRPKYFRELQGGRKRLELVPENTAYPSTGYTVGERSVSVKKYGRRFGYTFEMKINDQLDELMQVPGEFGNAAILTENYISLTQLANPSTGAPNTAFFNVGNGNLGTGVLNQANVEAARTVVTTKRDADGNLLYPGRLKLITGPALEITRERLLNQTEVRVVSGGTTTLEPNPLSGKMTGETIDDLPGNAWFIVPEPETAPIPAFYTGFLLGYETPDIRFKNDQGSRPGGGTIAPDEGSYDNDSVDWRCRHIVGSAQGDPLFTYASDGLPA